MWCPSMLESHRASMNIFQVCQVFQVLKPQQVAPFSPRRVVRSFGRSVVRSFGRTTRRSARYRTRSPTQCMLLNLSLVSAIDLAVPACSHMHTCGVASCCCCCCCCRCCCCCCSCSCSCCCCCCCCWWWWWWWWWRTPARCAALQ